MAITRRVRGSRSRAVFAAGLLMVSAIAALPARSADDGIPKLLSSSIDNGWMDGEIVVLRFDRNLKYVGSDTQEPADDDRTTPVEATVTVLDFEGTPVPGTLSLTFADFNTETSVLHWTYQFPEESRERLLPEGDFTLEYSVTSRSSGLVGTSAVPMPFKVDASAPFEPTFETPQSMEVVQSGELEIKGVVSDRPGELINQGAYKSGVEKVTLYFYNLANPNSYRPMPPDPTATTPENPTRGLPQNVETFNQGAKVEPCTIAEPSCTGIDEFGEEVVVQDVTFTAKVDLGPGMWTIKAVALDRALNNSHETSTTIVVT